MRSYGFHSLIAAIVVLVIGAGLTVFAINALRDAAWLKSLRATTGEIIATEIKQGAGDGEERPPYYYLALRYHYRVDLMDYESDSSSENEPYDEATSFKTLEAANSELQKFPINSAVKVYYDPKHPEKALLRRNTSIGGGVILLLIVGIPIVLCGLLLLFGFLIQAGLFPELGF